MNYQLVNTNLNIPFEIHEIQAEASFDHEGSFIKKGGNLTRIKLGGDERLSVALKRVEKETHAAWSLTSAIDKKLNYIAIDQGENGKFWLNTNSVTKRLHLSKKEIERKAVQEDLIPFLKSRAETIGKTISIFQQIISLYFPDYRECKKNLSLTTPAGKLSFVTPSTLMKVIKIAQEDLTSCGMAKYIAVSKQYFIIVSAKQGLEIFYATAPIADGGYGEIHRIVALHLRKTVVLKRAYPLGSIAEKAKRLIESESRLLEKIHEKQIVWGIQSKPMRFVDIKPPSTAIEDLRLGVCGFFGELYEKDYAKIIRERFHFTIGHTPKESLQHEILKETHQLLLGMKELSDQDIVHTDIKPHNIFVKKDKENWRLVHIADFGGAIEGKKELSFRYDIITPSYIMQRDLEIAKKNWTREQLLDLGKKTMVFSMGCVLYQSVTGKNPFDFDKQGYPKTETFKPLSSDLISGEIKDLIHQMLAEDYNQRPTPFEAFDQFNRHLESKHPKLHSEIQAKMSSYCQPQ